MHTPTRRAAIPNYALYGDQSQPGWYDAYDFEWIPQRSRPYNWQIQPHTHDGFLQILYMQQGHGEVLLNNTKWQMIAPCLVVVPARTVHGFHYSADTDGPVITAAQKPLESVAGMLMPELIQTIRSPAVIPHAESSRYADGLMPLFLAAEREFHTHAQGHSAAGMSLLTALLVQISRLNSVLEPAPVAAQSRKAAQVERFRTLVDRKFRSHHPVAAYASEMGMTPGQLSRICRELLGVSALDVINARLIHEAQRDLVYTPNSVKQLAASLGFNDEAYFGRFFRKHTNMSPRAFRKQVLQQMRQQDGGEAEGTDGAA